MKKTEIIPAILPRDFTELEDKISLVRGFVKTVQIDVCDGQFTPVPSWPYRKKDDYFERIVAEEQGLPGWQDLDFEIDLMVNRPQEVVEDWIRAGASGIIIHAEAGQGSDILKTFEIILDRVKSGLAINIETPADIIKRYEGKISFVQCMGVNRIGFQGQGFDGRVFDKIREIKKIYPRLAVSVDGGVLLRNAPELIEAGAERLVVGSAIFDSESIIETVQRFKRL